MLGIVPVKPVIPDIMIEHRTLEGSLTLLMDWYLPLSTGAFVIWALPIG
ncbi:Uncharacterised protein [Yersinia mollaretii]|nr:Uncharacterised protein [Yersinia mollaretii]